MMTAARLRLGAGLLGLLALFLMGATAPIPTFGDPGVEQVVAEVHQRLPGWQVLQATNTWEGGFSVVASCGAREIGFQVVPGHGLPQQDAWLQPNDVYARTRLEEVTDYPSYLIWRAQPVLARSLSCQEELARAFDAAGSQPSAARVQDPADAARSSETRTGRRPVD